MDGAIIGKRLHLVKRAKRKPQTARASRGTTIRIIFDPDVADEVQERVWFRSQKLALLPDGRIELQAQVQSLTGLDRWVFGWGSAAQVLQPLRLRRQIVRIAQTILERCG